MNPKIKDLIKKHYSGTIVAEKLEEFEEVKSDYQEVWNQAQKDLILQLVKKNNESGYLGLIDQIRKFDYVWEGENK